MPGTTPLGITYPCGGDTIDCTAMQTNAESIQDALDATQALADDALAPASVWVTRDTPLQSIAAGVTTTISYLAFMYDTDTMFNLATPTIITINTPGTYLAQLFWRLGSSPTTFTSGRGAILVNGVEFAYMKVDAGTSGANSGPPFYVSALLTGLTAGTQITTTTLFTGTGNMGQFADFSVMRVSTT